MNVDRDDGGIYKARNNNNNNARTIQDSRDMYVDKPIDYRRADRVIEVNWFIFGKIWIILFLNWICKGGNRSQKK